MGHLLSPGSDGLNWGPGLTAALIGFTAARPRPTTANTAAVFIVITAVMMGRLVATVSGRDAELGPGFTYASLGLILALIVIGPIGWRGWPPEL